VNAPAVTGCLGYADWLAGLLDEVEAESVVVVGHSPGAAIALSCRSPRVAGLVLVDPAGLVRVRLTVGVLAATLPWLTFPSAASSGRLLRLMLGPGRTPRPALIDWMTLIARHTRTSGAPGPLPEATLARLRTPVAVVTGEHDVFFPPRRLGPATRRLLGADLRVIAGAGHLTNEEDPDRLVAVVNALANR
jgi:pimeloyl-ACP methyl ester carboxylesterase